jgi:transcription elongation factor Elf1
MEEELERDMTPRLVGETWLGKYNISNTQNYSFGVFECQFCNKEFVSRVAQIKNKHTQSCGCQIGQKHKIHGLHSHKLYKTWQNLIQRCNNPKRKDYKDYGGRGITVCEEWLDVTIFIAWCESTHPNMEGYTLDRIDNDKGYNPENCRWVDRSTQSINQRIQKNNKSGVVGVHYYKGNVKWVAYISVTNTRKHIGYFDSIEEAVQARDNYIIENNLPHKLSTEYK